MAAEIETYLDEIEKSETHIAHLFNLLVRMFQSWKTLSRMMIYLANYSSVETRNQIVVAIEQFNGLMEEFKEMVDVIVSDRVKMISAMSGIIQWVYANFEAKK